MTAPRSKTLLLASLLLALVALPAQASLTTIDGTPLRASHDVVDPAPASQLHPSRALERSLDEPRFALFAQAKTRIRGFDLSTLDSRLELPELTPRNATGFELGWARNRVRRPLWDAWGNLRSSVGTSQNIFGFTGYEKDDQTGLYYAKARFFDPTLGRFLTEDPVLGVTLTPPSLHRYLYAYGNPTLYRDRLGLAVGDWWDVRSYADADFTSPAAAKRSLNFLKGEGEGFVSAGAGLAKSVAHPIETGKAIGKGIGAVGTALGEAIDDPGAAATNLAEGLDRRINNYVNSSEEEQGKVVGEQLFGVVAAGVGAKAFGAVRKGADMSFLGEATSQGLTEGAGAAAEELAPRFATRLVENELGGVGGEGISLARSVPAEASELVAGGTGRGSQVAFSRSAEDLVAERLGLERNPLGRAGDTVPGSGPSGVRYPEFKVYGPEGSLAKRGSIAEVKASRAGNPRSGLSTRDRAQIRDYVQDIRGLRAQDPLLGKAKVELFTDYPKPVRGEFRRFIEEGLLEWNPIPRQ